ncbi:uncharacterized protein [Procambarus clarkii]|uniref:uncharacterized protein n=1 Tax=Procambarus clarkii TaxID=6728 RepID=UPI00374450AC
MGEEVDVPLAAAAPPASPSSVPDGAAAAPPASPSSVPDGAAPPPAVSVPSADLPAPVAVTAAPGGLPDGFCVSSTSSSSSSPSAAFGPAPSLGVSAQLGAGGAVEHPVVCGPVPPAVDSAAAIMRRASVRTACEARGSGSASGSEDVRPEPKRSRRSSTAWADVKDFDAGGSSGDDVEDPGASRFMSMVVADVHVPADDDDCAYDSPPVLSSTEGSPQWGVVAPTDVGGVGAGAGRDLVLLLKKDVRRGGPLQVTCPVVAAEPCGTAKEAASALPVARPRGGKPLLIVLASCVAY